MAEAVPDPTSAENPSYNFECLHQAEEVDIIRTNSKLHRAAKKGRVRRLRKLCKAGIGPDVVNEQNQSPLFLAALHGRKHAVEFLLSQGADPNHACYDGSTPVHAACLACSPPVLCLLADAGGNISYHDNRGLLPRDWVSYQEDMHKRFEMTKFLEVMRLYAVGAMGDEKLSTRARSRWNAFMDYLRQFPERRQQRWRRRGWFTRSSRRRFSHRLGLFQRLPSLSCAPGATCLEMLGCHVRDISERDTLQYTSDMKVDVDLEQGEETYINPEEEVDGCQLQLSDSTYPEQTLYVDNKQGKIATTRMSPPRVTKPRSRRRRLAGIQEERNSFQQKKTQNLDKQSEGNGLSPNQSREVNDKEQQEKKTAGAGSGKTTLIIHGFYSGEVGKRVELKDEQSMLDNVEDLPQIGTPPAKGETVAMVKDENENYQGVPQREVLLEVSPQVLQKDEDPCEDSRSSPVTQEQDVSFKHPVARHSSSSTDGSSKNVFLDILDDAFKLELAPKVSELMADYCDSTQGSNAAPESFDFQSYHGDDTYNVDEVNWVGAGSSVSSDDHHNDQQDHQDNTDILSGQVKPPDLEQSSNDASAQADMDIDQLLQNTYKSNEDDEEDDKNFVIEGRYLDVQKMLSANLEMVFPPEGAVQLDGSTNISTSGDDSTEPFEDEESTGSNCLSGLSSLYQVSALDEGALISDVSLEVNVNESRRSLGESPSPPDLEDTHYDTPCGTMEERRAESDNTIKLHSALARMDLTADQEREVRRWFGGHGSVQNLIRDYETRIRENRDQDLTPSSSRSNETSLGDLLRRQFAEMVSRDMDGVAPKRCSSDTEALRHHYFAYPHAAMSDGKVTSLMEEEQEVSCDESWLWPSSPEENRSFAEELRKSMETVGIQCDNEDDAEVGGDRPTSERGDADKICRDVEPQMVSPPPPTCTPEEPPSHPHVSEESSLEADCGSRVNSSGDCETLGADLGEHGVIKPSGGTDSLTGRPAVPVPSGTETSPQSAARKKLTAIDVMRSPTVEAVEKTTH